MREKERVVAIIGLRKEGEKLWIGMRKMSLKGDMKNAIGKRRKFQVLFI